MTTPSVFSSNGLSISIYVPLIQGSEQIGDYSTEISNYAHNISAAGGFISADISISGDNNFAENWLQFGLGRHVVVRGSSMQTVWEGFVNQIDIAMGGVNFSRGPLTSLCNRVSAMYTPIIDYDPITNEPITGTGTETIIVEDEFSQSRYGIWEKLLNIGDVEKSDAEYIRDLYLAENLTPEGFPSLSIGSGNDISINIHCRGYIDWLSYVYNYSVAQLSIEASEKIKKVIDDDPNNIISTTYDKIDYNGVLINMYEDSNKLAKTVIDDVVTLGGGSDDRWTFGIYANREPVFKVIPTTVEYIYHKTEKLQQVETIDNQIVNPWDVVPCKWVAIPEFLTGFGIKIDIPKNDPRVFFGEEVTYTAPDQVSISGAKIRRLTQYMAKLGLGSI
jgi:hypothetical protein